MSYYTQRGRDLAGAWHEGPGHYIVARALGLAVPTVSIDAALATRETGSPANGFCSIPELDRAPLFDAITVLRAGVVGSRFGGYPFPQGAEADFAEISKRLYAAGIPGHEHNAIVARADRRAEKIIRANWDVAKALVEQLIAERTIRFGSPTAVRAVAPKPAPVTQVRRELLPMMTRAATLRALGDEYEVVFSTGAVVRRRDAQGRVI